MSARTTVQKLLDPAGIILDGPNPWDPQIHDEIMFDRFFRSGSIAIGETYMDKMWDVDDLPEMVARIMRSGIGQSVYKHLSFGAVLYTLRHLLFNLQNKARAFQVAEVHYDVGNDLYAKMLGPSMTYTCGYWNPPTGGATTLDEAQRNKLDLVCRKIGLKRGDRILDIGCGWGSLLLHAAREYGAEGVGVTVSKEQVALARSLTHGYPIEIRLQDYRDVCDGPYDHIVSLGMFEHVGTKNYRTYMRTVRELLKDDGLFLLHTIGVKKTGQSLYPWYDKYIFPNGYLPSAAEIGQSIDGFFVTEDWHSFGHDYDATLCAWYCNFDRARPELRAKYDDRFYRMWTFFLLTSAGAFRARYLNLWQIVLSPNGVAGGYQSMR